MDVKFGLDVNWTNQRQIASRLASAGVAALPAVQRANDRPLPAEDVGGAGIKTPVGVSSFLFWGGFLYN